MIFTSNNPKRYILKVNKTLLSNDDNKIKTLIDQQIIDAYFINMRLVVLDFFDQLIKSKTDGKCHDLISEMCDINALYSIQLKLNHELPSDLAEIAYDFDNPDYPGVVNVLGKIVNGEYLIQK